MTDDEILALFDGFRRSVGQRDERRDTLSIRATMAARRIRARGTVTERDLDLVGQIRAHSPASEAGGSEAAQPPPQVTTQPLYTPTLGVQVTCLAIDKTLMIMLHANVPICSLWHY